MNAPEKVVNLHDAADVLLRQCAIDELTWRLKDGKEVGGYSLLAILDSEMDNGVLRADSLIDVLTNYKERHLLADRVVDGLIERFLSTPKGREAIEEEMRRQDRYEPDPADWQEA